MTCTKAPTPGSKIVPDPLGVLLKMTNVLALCILGVFLPYILLSHDMLNFIK